MNFTIQLLDTSHQYINHRRNRTEAMECEWIWYSLDLIGLSRLTWFDWRAQKIVTSKFNVCSLVIIIGNRSWMLTLVHFIIFDYYFFLEMDKKLLLSFGKHDTKQINELISSFAHLFLFFALRQILFHFANSTLTIVMKSISLIIFCISFFYLELPSNLSHELKMRIFK